MERLICHSIIGKNPLKERIMTVDVTAEFIAPLTKFSSREIYFRSYQVHVRAIEARSAYIGKNGETNFCLG